MQRTIKIIVVLLIGIPGNLLSTNQVTTFGAENQLKINSQQAVEQLSARQVSYRQDQSGQDPIATSDS